MGHVVLNPNEPPLVRSKEIPDPSPIANWRQVAKRPLDPFRVTVWIVVPLAWLALLVWLWRHL